MDWIDWLCVGAGLAAIALIAYGAHRSADWVDRHIPEQDEHGDVW